MTDALAPLVPMAVEEPREPVDLDRILFRFLGLRPVAVLVAALRVDIGDERDLRPVAGPDVRRLRAGVKSGELFRVGAIGIADIQLHRAVPVRQKRHALAVGRPARCVFRLITGEQLFGRSAAVGGDAQDVRVAPARGTVGRRPDVEHRASVWRQRRIRDARRDDQVFDRHGAALLCGERHERGGEQDEKRDESQFHEHHLSALILPSSRPSRAAGQLGTPG